LPSFNVKKTLPLALGLMVPVLAVTGCPGLFGTTNPSPTPSATATPAAATRTTAVFTKLDIPSTGDRTLTLKNLSGSAIDLTKYAVSFEYKDTSLNMQHGRIQTSTGTVPAFAAGATLVVSEAATCSAGNCMKLDTALGGSTGWTKLGLQATHGSVALFKDATDTTNLTQANLVDYFQYGTDNTYTHAEIATNAKLWDSKTAVAVAPGAAGAAISVTTEGATGSANWKK